MSYRDKIDIMSRILEAANGGGTKIRIMYKALLSYKQMKEYANFMAEKGLLEYDSKQEGQVFRTTEKGLQFLDYYNRIRDIIRDDQQPPLH
jgi:predicted transcriptional regulator